MMLRTLPLLALLASLPLSASILHDWKFSGLPDGSPISAVPDTGSVGGLTWLDNEGNPGNYNSSGVVNGNYRVTRRLTGTTSFYADIADLTADSAPVWAVIELAGWNLVSRSNQILRFDFTTTTTGTMVAAQVRLNRDAREDASLASVSVGGNALGEGGVSIADTVDMPASVSGKVVFALKLDKASNEYEVSYLPPGGASFISLGTGKVSPARNGAALRINVNGSFSRRGEFLDISRIYLSTTPPKP
jgi:hypothetical protein